MSRNRIFPEAISKARWDAMRNRAGKARTIARRAIIDMYPHDWDALYASALAQVNAESGPLPGDEAAVCGNYLTPLASGLLDLQPVDKAFNDWIRATPDRDLQHARAKVALACVDLVAEHTAREVMAAEVTAARTTVVGLFEHRARRAGHPSVDGYVDYRDGNPGAS